MASVLFRIPRRLPKPSTCLFHSTTQVRFEQQQKEERPKEYELRVGYGKPIYIYFL